MQTLPEHGHQLRLLQASVLFLDFCPIIQKIKQITQILNYISGSKIIAMALNVSETVLIALTDTLQLMSFALKSNKGKVSILGVAELWSYCMVFLADQIF